MPTYVHNGTAFQELTGTDQPFVNVAGTFQGVKNVYVYAAGAWRTVYEYDITAPTIPTPTVVNATTSHTVSWTALSDNASGVASATLYQRFVGSTSGNVAGSSYTLPSFGAGSTSISVPLNRRKQGAGESWSAYYYIVATDAAGNTGTGSNSASMATTPYDVVNPTIASLSAVDTTSAFNTDSGMQRVTWGALTDDNTGVASATLYRWFYDSNGTWQGAESWNIGGSLGGSYLDLSVPTTRRKQGSGVTWYAYYRVTVTDNAGNTATADAGGYQTTTYDVTAPSVNAPSSSPNGSSYDVSWGAITDGGMGVSSATIYALYYGTTSGFVGGSSYAIPSGSFGGGSTTFSVPTNRRNTPGGEIWVVTYYIIATDAAGNSYQTGAATNRYTRPYGTYSITANASSSYDSAIPRWFPTNFTDPYDVRAGGATTSYTGLFFYGSKFADACLGFEPDNATMFVQRKASLGNSGTYRFAPCSDQSQPGGAPSPNVYDVVDVAISGADAGANVPIINWVTNLSSGSVGSIALLTVGTGSASYRQMYGAGAGYLNAGGAVTLTFN